ncbi:phage baseplate assembly protein V [uncultured Thiodictyon sp.]|uniref:phage baseplate assembly protein V n=1 Tax=uncultured Thiodictyon sp. TaxID=1846217 RepID=UPI0025D1A97E|nr:phage baseplate assembly protein V [uncultured Thiodictyon sp.]
MSDPVALIRAIVREELKALRLGDLAVVTSAFPHTDAGDAHNYECNVKLREGDMELRKVPIATPHLGQASAPQAGDLVLVSYVGGDPQRPIVVGRLYTEKARPPAHAEKEWRVESPLAGAASYAIDAEESLVLTAGATRIKIAKDGAVEITGEGDLKVELKGNASLTCTDAKVEASGNAQVTCADCKLDASGNVEVGDGAAGVITEATHKCYFTGAPLVGSKTVKAKG